MLKKVNVLASLIIVFLLVYYIIIFNQKLMIKKNLKIINFYEFFCKSKIKNLIKI